MGLSGSAGLTLGGTDSLLTDRAADFLATGPADAQSLISHVCQLPGAPLNIAEHMAAALFAGHRRFVRDSSGRWGLRDLSTQAAHAVVTTRGLKQESFVVVDVEATGSRAAAGDRITEIAVVLVRDGTANIVFDTLINPERPIPPMVTALTNITSSMVRNAPRFAEVCDQLLGVLEGHVFVAHNAGFDWRFITTEVERATHRRLEGRSLCTVRLSKRLLPRLRRRNLDAVTAYYGIENKARHRAGGDALATAHVLLRLLDEAHERGCMSLDDLDRLARTPSARRKRSRRPSAMPHPAGDDSVA
jgi:DNA polymerase-3 subunit epsilon